MTKSKQASTERRPRPTVPNCSAIANATFCEVKRIIYHFYYMNLQSCTTFPVIKFMACPYSRCLSASINTRNSSCTSSAGRNGDGARRCLRERPPDQFCLIWKEYIFYGLQLPQDEIVNNPTCIVITDCQEVVPGQSHSTKSTVQP